MKRFWMACVLALPLTALPQQKASAWGGDFTVGGGFNWWYTIGCKPPCCGAPAGCDHGTADFGGYGAAGCAAPGCAPAGTPVASYYGYPGASYYGYPGAYYGYGQLPGGTPAVAPAPVAQYPALNTNPYGFQPVGYFSAPSYWYGR
jgi:hypothetical protein